VLADAADTRDERTEFLRFNISGQVLLPICRESPGLTMICEFCCSVSE
jgi:hypothetical protein